MKRNRCKNVIAGILVICLAILYYLPRVYVKASNSENRILVSLGDSYSSGEGIEPFYGQDQKFGKRVKDENWLAHRSKNSWASLLTLPGNPGAMSEGWETYWFFRASSGAETIHLNNEQPKDYGNIIISGTAYLKPQLTIFNELPMGSVDYVTITIGGNDVGFAEIIKDCAAQGIPFVNKNRLKDRFDATWREFNKDGGTADKIMGAYKDIKEKAGAQAKIIVAGYPPLLSKDKLSKNGTGAFFSEAEVEVVNKNVKDFNEEIESIVTDCQKESTNIYFVSVENAFKGHEAYSDEPYISGILLTQDQDLTKNPISSYSMHPNLEGAKAYAACVQAEIDRIEKLHSVENKIRDKIDNAANEIKEDIKEQLQFQIDWNAIWKSFLEWAERSLHELIEGQ